MSKFILTLPIVTGKEYVRRDGLVVKAQKSFNTDMVCVGYKAKVYRETGRMHDIDKNAAFDLVQDYIEPGQDFESLFKEAQIELAADFLQEIIEPVPELTIQPMTLTLPIVAGKNYVRRDGTIIVCTCEIFNVRAYILGAVSVSLKTGRMEYNGVHEDHPHDLISDYDSDLDSDPLPITDLLWASMLE